MNKGNTFQWIIIGITIFATTCFIISYKRYEWEMDWNDKAVETGCRISGHRIGLSECPDLMSYCANGFIELELNDKFYVVLAVPERRHKADVTRQLIQRYPLNTTLRCFVNRHSDVPVKLQLFPKVEIFLILSTLIFVLSLYTGSIFLS